MLLCRELRNLTTRNGSDIATADYDISYLDGNGNYVNGHRTGETFFITRPSSTNPTTCTASNRCTSRQVFDARERLLRHETGTGQVTTYALDEPAMLLNDTTIRAGNVTTEVDNGGGTSTTTNRYYTSNQLTKTTTTAGGSSQSAWYWYDTLSNLSCISNTATRPWCGPAASGTLLDGLLVDYDYDYLERLRSIRYYAASGRTDHTTYRYDVLDRTVSQREDHGTGSTGTTHDRTTRFTYLGMTTAVTEETSEPLNGGAITRTKNYDYDATGTRTSMTDTPTGGTPTFYSYGYDPHGSVNQLLTATGTIKASYGYDAYGNQDNAPTAANDLSIGDITPQAPLNPYRYTGKRIDPGTAATSSAQPEIGAAGYDMGARRYSPQTTRFLQDDIYSSALSDLALSTDPLTANRYSLAAGNPTSYIETDGHMVKEEGGTSELISTYMLKDEDGEAEMAFKVALRDAGEFEEHGFTQKQVDAHGGDLWTDVWNNKEMIARSIGRGIKKTAAVTYDLSGAKDCFENGSTVSCAGITPWGRALRILRGADAALDAAKAANRTENAANPAIGFTDDAVGSAFQGMRSGGGHAIRHLRDEGLIANKGSLASQVAQFQQLTSPILRSPAKTFDWKLGTTMTRGFAGEAGGRQVVVFVAKEGPYQGRVLSAVVPDAGQMTQWGLP